MARKIVFAILTVAWCATSMLAGTIPSNAQINGFGTSTAGGSGGTPTGPTNFTGIYGSSLAGGSGGVATGPTDFGTEGFGLSTAGDRAEDQPDPLNRSYRSSAGHLPLMSCPKNPVLAPQGAAMSGVSKAFSVQASA